MGLRNLEAAILAELKQVAKNNKIRQRDIVEWSTGAVKPQEGEKYFHLPKLGVHVCVVLPAKKAAQQNAHPTLGESATSQAVSEAETLSTSDSVPPSAPVRVA